MINAKDPSGTPVHILHAQKASAGGDRYTCEHCDDRVIPVQGRSMPWHFRHRKRAGLIGKETPALHGCLKPLNGVDVRLCVSRAECREPGP